jgi:glutaredoxin-related protein
VIRFVTTLVTAAQLAAAGFVGSAIRILKRIGQRYIELFNVIASQQTNSQLPVKYCAQCSSEK